MMPLRPTQFAHNPYRPEWHDQDFFYSPDGIGEFPQHHCKQTFILTLPYITRFRNALDIGCRDGEYSRYLHQHFARTYCFDPRVMRNFCYNVDLSKVTHYSCALGDVPGVIQMCGGTHRQIKGFMWEAPCFTLDQFEFEAVDYIKIDVEGFELKVLRGGEQTILKHLPLIVIEQNDVRLPDETPLAAKIWLEKHGYVHVASCPRGWDYVMVHRGW
jgi:FkbM family methyltransferase